MLNTQQKAGKISWSISVGYLRRKRKSKVHSWPVTIYYDDREKKPWRLQHLKFVFERKRLETGDYTIKGLENTIAVERKASLHEFITNIGGRDRERFKATLGRLSAFKFSCIIIEDSLENVHSALAKIKRTRLTAASVYYWISKITVVYGIPVLFIGKNSRVKQEMLINFFEALVKNYG